MSIPMKTLTIGGNTYEIVDETARKKIPDVTGATVGQTILVAAVDDNGVPTAWEPVDLPGVSDEWELINHLTVEEEDVQVIKISEDSDGNAFRCKEMRIFIALPQVNSALSLYFSLILGAESSGNYRSHVDLYQNASDQNVVGHFTPMGGWFGTKNCVVGDACDRGYSDTKSLDPITGLKITTATWDSQVFWVGTDIYLYGVRT